jgi:hypothetical protein
MKRILALALLAVLPVRAEPIDFARAAETIVVDAKQGAARPRGCRARDPKRGLPERLAILRSTWRRRTT